MKKPFRVAEEQTSVRVCFALANGLPSASESTVYTSDGTALGKPYISIPELHVLMRSK